VTIPSSGPVRLQSIATEFGGTAPLRLSQYYRGGGRTDAGAPNVPTSGRISLGAFRGAAKVVPGSANFITPGTATFTVPFYNQMTVEVWGAGGSGGGGFNFGNGVAGGPSAVAGLGLTAGGGGAGQSRNNGYAGGAGGVATGGNDRNWNGEAGNRLGTVTSGRVNYGGRDGFRFAQNLEPGYTGDTPGTPDGGGGRGGYGNGNGGGGGGGAYLRSVYTAGAVTPGANLTLTIGAGGPGLLDGSSGPGGAGARGRVFIAWS
jgi:hypothetical protein